MKELFQHAAVSHGVTVRVAVNFLPEQSRIEAGKWFWVYHIRLENDGPQAVQLLTRHWRITDGRGMVNHVEGGFPQQTWTFAPALDPDRHPEIAGFWRNVATSRSPASAKSCPPGRRRCRLTRQRWMPCA